MLLTFLTYIEAPIFWVIKLIREICHEIKHWIQLKIWNLIEFFYQIKIVSFLIDLIQRCLIYTLSVGPVPNHVSFIMDGNRRYAKLRNLPVNEGHKAGGVTLLNLIYVCKRIGVKCISCYAFSIENFNRSKEEVDTLMELFAVKLDEFAQKATNYRDPLYGSTLKIIGDQTLLSEEMRIKIKKVEDLTNNGDDFTVYICFPYTSRNDIVHSIQTTVLKKIKSNANNKNTDDNDEGTSERNEKINITEKDLNQSMYLNKNFGDKCDILIRTSGHIRLSDFMLWQSHQNTTIEFNNSLWPDFNFIKVYLLLLKWSFYRNIQKHRQLNFSLRRYLLSCIFSCSFTTKHVDYYSLPNPPLTVSTTDKSC